jgi:carbon-monoxide dehydrogenase small subunit
VQEAFWKHHALQCGFCTPGMVMSAVAFLAHRPTTDEAEIRHEIAGNLCRCTGYQFIVDAIQDAAAQMKDAAQEK